MNDNDYIDHRLTLFSYIFISLSFCISTKHLCVLEIDLLAVMTLQYSINQKEKILFVSF